MNGCARVTAVHEWYCVLYRLQLVCCMSVCGSLMRVLFCTAEIQYTAVWIWLRLTLATCILELVYSQLLALRKNVHQSWPLALSTLSVRGRERVAVVSAKRTFTVPGPWPLSFHSFGCSYFLPCAQRATDTTSRSFPSAFCPAGQPRHGGATAALRHAADLHHVGPRGRRADTLVAARRARHHAVQFPHALTCAFLMASCFVCMCSTIKLARPKIAPQCL